MPLFAFGGHFGEPTVAIVSAVCEGFWAIFFQNEVLLTITIVFVATQSCNDFRPWPMILPNYVLLVLLVLYGA